MTDETGSSPASAMTEAAPDLAIEARGLTKAYVDDVNVVDRLDLRVPYGFVYCLLGPNGAGKTTTIRMLTTLLVPTAGEALVAGHPVTDVRAVRSHIGVALQDVAMDPAMTPVEHLDLSLRLAGYPARERDDRRDTLIERFGLSEYASRRTGQLSGGMQRRADIALAVASDPIVLFLDEPSSGLDIEGREEVWEVVHRLREEGRTVLLTTHDLGEAVELSDVVGIMRGGRIHIEGEPAELTSGADIVVSDVSDGVAPHVVAALTDAGLVAHRNGAEVRCELPSATVAGTAAVLALLERVPVGGQRVRVTQRGLRELFLEATR